MVQPLSTAARFAKELEECMSILRKYHKDVDEVTVKELASGAKVDANYKPKGKKLNSKGEDVTDLVEAYQNGNDMAFDVAFSLLIPYLTSLYRPDMMPKDYDYRDYIQTSYILTKDSAKVFKRTKKDDDGNDYMFKTFIAMKFVSGYIYEVIDPNPYGMSIQTRVKKMMRYVEKYEAEHGCRPTTEQIAKAQNIGVKTVEQYFKYASYRTVSIYQDGDGNEESDEYMLDIVDETATVDKVDNVCEEIRTRVLDLPKERAQMVMLYHGFIDIPGAKKFRGGYTIEDVCAYLNIKPSKLKKELALANKTLKRTLLDYATADL